jgi:hypothetical protein
VDASTQQGLSDRPMRRRRDHDVCGIDIIIDQERLGIAERPRYAPPSCESLRFLQVLIDDSYELNVF